MNKENINLNNIKNVALPIALALMVLSPLYPGMFLFSQQIASYDFTFENPSLQPDPDQDIPIVEHANPAEFKPSARSTRAGEELDLDLKWFDGFGSIIGYMNSIKSADVDNDGEQEIVFSNYEGLVYVTGKSDTGYIEEWKVDIGTFAYGLSLDDVDLDGTMEIIVGDQEGFMNIYGHNGTTYVLEWTSPDLGNDLYGLTTDDVDEDGAIEIIAGASYTEILDDNIFIYSWDGSSYIEEWTFALPTTLGYLGLFNVEVGDVDDDGAKEIVFASYENEILQNDPPVNPIPPNPRPSGQFGGRFYVFGYTHGSGSLEWQSDDFGEWIIGMDIGNTDLDADLEIVIGLYFGEIHVYSYFSFAYISQWVSDGEATYALTVARIDDAEFDSIIIGSWNNISVFHYFPGQYQEVFKSLGLDSFVYGMGSGDIDLDGATEEVLCGTNYKFYVHSYDGDTYFIMSQSVNVGAVESISSADLDEDGVNEIYMGMGNGSVLVTNLIGDTLVIENSIKVSTKTITHLAVADVDDDGEEEIIVVEGNTSMFWTSNFIFRGGNYACDLYIVGYSDPDYVLESQLRVETGSTFCIEVGDIDEDDIPEIVLAGTGFDEPNNDPFVGQMRVIQFNDPGYSVVWESGFFYNWIMGVAVGDVDDDGHKEIICEDYDSDIGTNLLRLFEYNGATFIETDTIPIDSENYALDVRDVDNDGKLEMITKGAFTGLLEVIGNNSGDETTVYTREWSTGDYITFIDECFASANIPVGGDELLIFGELGIFVYEHTTGDYQEIWQRAEVTATIKLLHVADVDVLIGNEILGSFGGYNFIYGTIGIPPIAVLEVSDDTVKIGDVLEFDGSLSTGEGALQYFFDFGDGTNSDWVSTPIVYHAYSSPGIFNASLKVRDETMLESLESKATITVLPGNQKPIAIIDSISPNPATYGSPVHFVGHGTDDGNIAGYDWRSDRDGWLSNQPDFNLSALSWGEHIISFCVRDDEGVWSDYNFTYLRINQIPEADINYITPKTANLGDTITFSGEGSDDRDITAYNWRSSINGFISSSASFSTSSLSAGSHIIYFKVRDDDGVWSEEESDTLDINQIPQAHIESISPNPALAGEFVTFTGYGTDDGDILGYRWESDKDGELSSRSYFSTASLSIGEHTITFYVRDDKGEWSEGVEDELTVNEPQNVIPKAFIDEVSPTKAKKGEIVTFIGHGEDDDGRIVEYLWESDMDGQLNQERSFSTSDLDVGTHVITFKVMDDSGAWSEPVETIVVIEKAKDDGDGDTGPIPLDTSSVEENPWLWFLILIVIIVLIVIIAAVVLASRNKKEKEKGPYHVQAYYDDPRMKQY
ncbi:MAG: hypothetical protein JSW00_01620 [Thermoplasmata archaeon]|nr:MAG: hypothetical protein JSW00_01620 [Thermoplasmata archaeon]